MLTVTQSQAGRGQLRPGTLPSAQFRLFAPRKGRWILADSSFPTPQELRTQLEENGAFSRDRIEFSSSIIQSRRGGQISTNDNTIGNIQNLQLALGSGLLYGTQSIGGTQGRQSQKTRRTADELPVWWPRQTSHSEGFHTTEQRPPSANGRSTRGLRNLSRRSHPELHLKNSRDQTKRERSIRTFVEISSSSNALDHFSLEQTSRPSGPRIIGYPQENESDLSGGNAVTQRGGFDLEHQTRAQYKQEKRENHLGEQDLKLEEFDDDDYPEGDMMGVPINLADFSTAENDLSEKDYKEKYENDKKRILDYLASLKTKEEIKRARFLFISAQTYGDIDGSCMPAELAICEFTLKHGIIDEFHTVVGPWKITNEIQRRRATYHANETHQIYLENYARKPYRMPTQQVCIREILGRSEPMIARDRGISVGLYRYGIREFDFETANNADTSAARRKTVQQRSDLSTTNKSTNSRGRSLRTAPLLAGERHGRRWLICLSHEYNSVRGSLIFLKKAQHLDYDGFPTSEDRFIFADALVDAMAEHVNATPNQEYKLWMDLFGKRQPFDFRTPWELRANIFCSRHSATSNCCCASATAARSCFAIFFALTKAYDLPYEE